MSPFGKPIEQILGAGFLLLVGIGCLIVLQPFLSALLWAGVICFSTWPIHEWLARMLGSRRRLIALLMTLLITLMLVTPLALVVAALADNASAMVSATTHMFENGLPAPPPWIARIPLIGGWLSDYWTGLAQNSPDLIDALKSLIRPGLDITVATGTKFGAGLFELSLSVFIAFFFFLHGRTIAAYGRRLADQFAGPRAPRLIEAASGTLKGVVYGLIGTALAQAGVTAIGFWIAGVPNTLLLCFATFVLSFAPVGPPLVWIPVALWLIMQGSIGWGIFIALWGLFLISSIDNIVRPVLIGRTSDLPILLSLFGLVGGVIAFGLVGIFLGPTLLAVGYSLAREWIGAEPLSRALPESKTSKPS